MEITSLFALRIGLFALAGLLFGSFANVCIHRMPMEETVVRGRSRCPHCESTIRWYDNIPVLSYLFLLGRCRSCRGPIAISYALVELATAIGFTAAGYVFAGASAVAACALIWALVVTFMIDLRHRIIPDEISLGFLALGLLLSGVVSFEQGYAPPLLDLPGLPCCLAGLPAALVGAFTGGGCLALVRVLGGRYYGFEVMGLGDVKLMAMLGAWLGAERAVLTFFYGALIGGVISLLMILFAVLARLLRGQWSPAVLRGAVRDKMRSFIPFGPFLAIGGIIALFTRANLLL